MDRNPFSITAGFIQRIKRYLNFTFPTRGNVPGRDQGCCATSPGLHFFDEQRSTSFVSKYECVMERYTTDLFTEIMLFFFELNKRFFSDRGVICKGSHWYHGYPDNHSKYQSDQWLHALTGASSAVASRHAQVCSSRHQPWARPFCERNCRSWCLEVDCPVGFFAGRHGYQR